MSCFHLIFRVHSLLIAFVAFLSHGCSGSGNSTSFIFETRMPIEGGSIDFSRRAVVGIKIREEQEGLIDYYKVCTGALIAPNLVLTAQHCISESSLGIEAFDCNTATFLSPYDADQIEVTTDHELFLSYSQFFDVKEVVTPRSSIGENWIYGNDIALLILEENIPATDTIPLIPRLDEPVLSGETYRAVGFGTTGPFNTNDGVRRQRRGLSVECVSNECITGIHGNEFNGSEGACGGDSGGPALDAANHVLGILSRSDIETCQYPTYTGVYQWRGFIREQARRAQVFGGYGDLSWFEANGDRDGDSIADGVDNCPLVSNITQEDTDGDFLGDLCDDAPGVAPEDCNICEECWNDSDCDSGSGSCVAMESTSYCFVDCTIGCPIGTACYSTPTLEGSSDLCLNENAATEGICPSSFVCGPD